MTPQTQTDPNHAESDRAALNAYLIDAYTRLIERTPGYEAGAVTIVSVFFDQLPRDVPAQIEAFFFERPEIIYKIIPRREEPNLFGLAPVLLVYYLAATDPAMLIRKWPFGPGSISKVFDDLGIPLDWDAQ